MSTMNIFDLTDTWNAGGTTFTAIKMNVTDTLSDASSLLIDLQVGSTSQFKVTKTGVLTAPNSVISNYLVPQIHIGFTGNSTLVGATGNAIEQRNGTNAQAFRVYNTYTDASNYERFELGFVSNVPTLRHTSAGTGTARAISLISGTGTINLDGGTGSGADVVVRTGGAGSENNNATLSIRANNALHLYFGRISSQNGIFNSSAAMILGFSTASMVQLFGTTSSFPSLKRSSATLQARLADDSAFAAVAGLVDLTATQAADSIGTRGVPQNSQSAAYTLVIEDAGKHILHPSADTTARTFTIPANGSVTFPVGTVVTFVNQNAGGVITIAITTDTMRLAGAGTTGSRTLAANGIATAIKVTSTEWLISGTGLT